MATDACLFLTFLANGPGNTALSGLARQTFSYWIKPPGVFAYSGVATEDKHEAPTMGTNLSSMLTTASVTDSSGRFRSCGKYGNGNSAVYNSSSNPTYSAFNSNKAFQLAVKRSTYSITSEIYYSFDWTFPSLPNSSVSGHEPTAEYEDMFRWGDVSIRCKSTTWTGSNHTVVLSIRNNGSEVTTLTVTGVTVSTRQFMRIHVKLDATTGLIDCDCNGTAQAASYTNQNTVATTSLATASFIFFGPPVLDNNSTQAYAGSILHAYFSTVSWSTGRPIGIWYTPFQGAGFITDGTMTNWYAQGTSVTTLSNALSSYTDAKAARGYGFGAEALFQLPSENFGNFASSILSLEVAVCKASNRDLVSAKRLSAGFSLSGAHMMGTVMVATALPTDTVATPPATNYTPLLAEYFFNPAYTTSDWSNLRIRLLVT